MIGIAGAGAFGTALAVALAEGGNPVRLWGRAPGLAQRRESARLPGSCCLRRSRWWKPSLCWRNAGWFC